MVHSGAIVRTFFNHLKPARATLLCALFAAGSVGMTVAQTDRLAEGKKLAEAGRCEAALEELDLYKQEHPRDARGFLYSAVALLKADRRLDAEIELATALASPPESETDLLALANTLDQLGRPELAAEALQKVRAAGNLRADGLWLLADLQLRLHRASEASQTLDAYVALKPRDPAIPRRRGQIELMAGRLEPALEAFEDARDLDPSDSEALFGMGSVLFQGNNPEAAIKILRRALELKPGDSRSLHLLGLSLAAMQRYPEAVDELAKAAAVPGSEARVYFDLGNARRRAGDDEGAREALSRYQALFRKSEEENNRAQLVVQLLNQGRQQLQSSQMEPATASFNRVLEVEPDNWPAHSLLAKIDLSGGRFQRALQHLEQMIRIAPDSSEAHYLTALALYQTRDLERALQQAETAKKLRPGYPELRNLLGNILFALGRPADALREYDAATKLDPDQPSYRLNYQTLAKSTGS